ncbi:hypothetical protein [Treponema sp.]|uniref:hypothetical protein n=1 Tax=Treponema sp. TaxID=166 RepID=UPI003890FADA
MSVIAVTAGLLVLFNILMWFIFLLKFNSRFSTEKILDDYRDAINDSIRDANRAAERNMDLMDAKIQELNKVKAEADRRLAVLRRELETQQREMEFRAAVNASGKSAKKSSASYGARKESSAQTELAFNENVPKVQHVEEKTAVAEPPVTLQEIPIVKSVVYRTDDQIVPKKDFFQQVREYHMAGLPSEEIARLTGRSAQEVRLVLQML